MLPQQMGMAVLITIFRPIAPAMPGIERPKRLSGLSNIFNDYREKGKDDIRQQTHPFVGGGALVSSAPLGQGDRPC